MKTKSYEHTLHDYVQLVLKEYLAQLGDESPTNLYEMVIGQAETGLLKTVLTYAKGNLSKTAEYLGINRATLRKKLKQYDLNG